MEQEPSGGGASRGSGGIQSGNHSNLQTRDPEEYDTVRPAHYRQHPSGVECVTIVEHFDFLIGNVIKYAWRSGLKPGAGRLEDLKKMAWYAQRAVEKEQRPSSTFAPDEDSRAYGLDPAGAKPEDSRLKPAITVAGDWEQDFITNCQTVIDAVHQNALDKGWWDDPRNDGETLALVHSELSEALTALRDGNPPDDKVPGFSQLEIELADAVIRIFDYAGGCKLNLTQAIIAKMRYNKTRPRKHGKLF